MQWLNLTGGIAELKLLTSPLLLSVVEEDS